MPFYSFYCQDCRKKFEVLVDYHDYDKYEPRCPDCESENVNRIIGRIKLLGGDVGSSSDRTTLSTRSTDENNTISIAQNLRTAHDQESPNRITASRQNTPKLSAEDQELSISRPKPPEPGQATAQSDNEPKYSSDDE